MNKQLTQALKGGIGATAAFDIQGLFLTGKFWDIPNLLADKLHAPFAAGLALHYTLGVVLAVLYIALAPLIPGPRWAKPFVFMTAQTVIGVWLFMMPLLGAGVMGLGVGATFPIISMVRHWAYAAVLGGLTGAFRRTGAAGNRVAQVTGAG